MNLLPRNLTADFGFPHAKIFGSGKVNDNIELILYSCMLEPELNMPSNNKDRQALPHGVSDYR